MKRADEGMGFLLQYENVAWYEDGCVRILDRRIYPVKTEFVVCRSYTEVAQAIADMVTQSAGPYTAAAMGMALAAYEVRQKSIDEIREYLKKAEYALSHARPTTSEKMQLVTGGAMETAEKCLQEGRAGQQLVDALQEYAFNYINDTYKKYMPTGLYLAEKIPDGGTVMTQCFGETIIGTMLTACRRQGKEIKMICAETRPYYQGARLTASVGCDMGFDVTVITDNMPAYVLKARKVDVFTSAADVITMDGYVVNKIGTFQIALGCQYWGIPYYVTGTPNLSHPNIDSVTIEERDPQLVMESMGTKLTMEGVKGFYPAFDITPPKLCDGVVTDRGIFVPTNLYAYYEAGPIINQALI